MDFTSSSKWNHVLLRISTRPFTFFSRNDGNCSHNLVLEHDGAKSTFPENLDQKLERKFTTGWPSFPAWRTAATRSLFDSVYKLVTRPGWPALAVRPTLCMKSTADEANSAYKKKKKKQNCMCSIIGLM